MDGGDHALDAPVSEAPGDQDPVRPVQLVPQPFLFDFLRIDEAEVHPAVVGDAAVNESLVEAFVGVVRLTYFPTMAMQTSPEGPIIRSTNGFPCLQVRLARPDVQEVDDLAVQAFPVKFQRDLVDAADVLWR